MTSEINIRSFSFIIIMIPFKEVAIADKNSEFRGVPPIELMENAGKGLADVISKRFPDKQVLFVCGTGNNGGDAYVAARYISENISSENITVFLIKGEENIRSEISRKNFKKLECEIIEKIDWSNYKDHLIVDALLGTGIKGEIREPYRTVMKRINDSGNPIISVDVPSGLSADLRVDPDMTVTFHDVKIGMNEDNCGEIIIKDIGIPQKAIDYTGPGEMLLYPKPKDDSHKGDNGNLLVVGGGPYTGAPALAARAAYRTGADLVHLAVPSEIKDVIAGYSESFIVHPLEGKRLKKSHLNEIIEISKRCDAAVIGPGLGYDENTLKAVKLLTERLDIPILIDADGLKAVSKYDIKYDNECILTPHGGEFMKLCEDGEYPENAVKYAEEHDVTLIVKGKEDLITDGVRKKWNDFGNPAMTVGGTGDTLSGVIGALLSKGMDPYEAGRLGSYMTCRAGDIAFKSKKWGLLPEDIAENIVDVLES